MTLCTGTLVLLIAAVMAYSPTHSSVGPEQTEIVRGNEAAVEKDKTRYVENLLQIDLQEYIVAETGEIIVTSEEEYAYICFTLKPDSIEEVTSILTENLGEGISPEEYIIPGYNGNALARQMESQELIRIYPYFTSGQTAKTRSIEIYLTQDEDRNPYLYLFG